MSEKDKKKKTKAEEVAAETEAAPETCEPDLDALKAELEKAKEELAGAQAEKEAAIEVADKVRADSAELKDSLLRISAEYDNFRRRSQKEREGVYSDAYSDAINALLPVLDNLGRAVGCEDPKALADGLALILKSFDEGLAKLGVEEIKALGETFDPERHYAVLHVEDESYGENEVVEVLQKGYTRGDKVIRYAVVKVAN